MNDNLCERWGFGESHVYFSTNETVIPRGVLYLFVFISLFKNILATLTFSKLS